MILSIADSAAIIESFGYVLHFRTIENSCIVLYAHCTANDHNHRIIARTTGIEFPALLFNFLKSALYLLHIASIFSTLIKAYTLRSETQMHWRYHGYVPNLPCTVIYSFPQYLNTQDQKNIQDIPI